MTDISVGKFNFLCRLCMTSLVNGAYEIFEENTQIWNKIAVCLQIKIEQNDSLPKSVCKSCVTKLDEFYSYRESCLQTEVVLRKCISNCNSTSQLPVKSENENKDDTDGEKQEANETTQKESSADEGSLDGKKINADDVKKEPSENNISDAEMSPAGENVGMSDEDEDEEMDEDKEGEASLANENADKSQMTRAASLPELAEPSPEDYVLMKEETFNLDPVKDVNASRGATSSILADYLIEFSNSKSGENEIKDKDVMESQRLRREVLPPMWDVYEKSITEKENVCSSDGTNGEKERTVTVTHRRYIINKGAFPCSLCGECFEFDQGKRRDDFAEEKSKLYDCLTCGKVFPRRSSWKRHQSTHEDVKPFVCRLCNKGFNRKEHLSRHLLSHGSVRPYSCGVCSKQFVRKEHLTRHQLCNPPCAVTSDNVMRPFGCDVCSQGFVRKEHLIRHRKRAHDLDPPEGEAEPKPFTCNVCTKTFTRREHLKRHQLIHQRDFSNSLSLGSRLFAAGPNSKDDSFQEVSIFPSPSLLPEITLSEVTGGNGESENRLYDGSAQNLSLAIENNDGGVDHQDDLVQYGMGCGDEDVEMDDDADEPLPPIPVLEMNTNAANMTPSVVDITKSNTFCNVCFKNFSRRSHLLRHMKRIHSMQLPPSSRRKPQQQQQQPQPVPVVVPQQAKSGGDENGNSLTDSSATAAVTPTPPQPAAEQTYKCQLCGKVFSRRSHLERHEKNIHQLDKEANQPYECVTCGETFIQSKLLDKHMQVHGNTVPENYVWM